MIEKRCPSCRRSIIGDFNPLSLPDRLTAPEVGILLAGFECAQRAGQAAPFDWLQMAYAAGPLWAYREAMHAWFNARLIESEVQA